MKVGRRALRKKKKKSAHAQITIYQKPFELDKFQLVILQSL
jgi:hypothetical protein